nr:hypothetical protein [Tanacetum cinerariifolium]
MMDIDEFVAGDNVYQEKGIHGSLFGVIRRPDEGYRKLVGKGLKASRKLKPGALSLYVGNGQREAVEAIGAFYLYLPSGLEIVLNNFHYALSITRGVISVSYLYEDGFVNLFMDNTIQVSRNNMVYFSIIPRDANSSCSVALAGQHVAPEILAAHNEVKDSVCPASRAGASLDYERFPLLQIGRRANYNMHSMGKTANELHAMLNLHEQTLPKNNAPALNAIRAGKVQKAYAPKPKIPPPPKREDLAKDSICHECGKIGYWKRNCLQYLAELLKKKKNAASGLVVQGLKASRKLKPGALSLYKTTSLANNSVFRGFFEKQKLTGPNFIDWYRQLRIVLSIDDKLNYLEQPIPLAPVAPAGQHVTPEILAAHNGVKDSVCPASRVGASSDYERFPLLQIGRRANYNMHSMGKTANELHAMLNLHEQTLPKNNAPALNAIRAGKVQKGHWKRNCLQYLAELLKKKKNTASGLVVQVKDNEGNDKIETKPDKIKSKGEA